MPRKNRNAVARQPESKSTNPSPQLRQRTRRETPRERRALTLDDPSVQTLLIKYANSARLFPADATVIGDHNALLALGLIDIAIPGGHAAYSASFSLFRLSETAWAIVRAAGTEG